MLKTVAKYDESSVDITGGTINGTSIGATTPADGTFTTLDANGNVTLGDASTDTVTIAGPLTTTAGNVVINESGGDFDFRVESDTNTHALFVDGATGNVGIGTSSPDRRLAVEQSLNGVTGIVASNPSVSSGAVALIESRSDSASGFFGAGGSATTTSTWGGRASTVVLSTSSSGSTGGIAVMARNSAGIITMHTGGDTERLRIDSSGNVGIGTSSPAARLELTPDSGLRGIRVYRAHAADGAGFEGVLFALNNSSGSKIDYASIAAHSTTVNAGAEAGRISFRTRGSGALTERMRIDSSGALIAKPAAGTGAVFNEDGVDADFRVESDTNTHAFFVQGSDGNVGIGTSSPSATLDIEGLGNTVAAHIFTSDNVSNATASLVFGTTPGARSKASIQMVNINTGNAEGALAFSTNNGGTLAERLRIDGSGNVGIGTSSPSEKLEVSGNIKTSAPTGGTAAAWKLGTVASVSPTSPDRTIEVEINGTTYYLHAKTTND